MKNLFTAIRSAFCGKTYSARMIIAGNELTMNITAPDRLRALEEAERIIDDCGFLIGLTESPMEAPQWTKSTKSSMTSNTRQLRQGGSF